MNGRIVLMTKVIIVGFITIGVAADALAGECVIHPRLKSMLEEQIIKIQADRGVLYSKRDRPHAEANTKGVLKYETTMCRTMEERFKHKGNKINEEKCEAYHGFNGRYTKQTLDDRIGGNFWYDGSLCKWMK